MTRAAVLTTPVAAEGCTRVAVAGWYLGGVYRVLTWPGRFEAYLWNIEANYSQTAV